MELKVKFLKWSAGLPVAMLHKTAADKVGVHAKERIVIKSKSKEMFTVLDIITGNLIKKNEIAVSSEIRQRMNLKKAQKIDVLLTSSPKSLSLIKKKLNKTPLSEKEIYQIIEDVANNSLFESEIALFVSGMYKQGMSIKETIYLIKAILKTGNKLSLKSKIIADKHSIGGIAGRTTPIVVSICVAAGLVVPKTSSRAITTPAGTVDAIETLTQVDFTMSEIKQIIKKTKGCIVWGGSLGMVPADSKIIQVEKQLNIDPEAQLLASIMAKKLAVGSTHLLIHLPYGRTAKITRQKALKLKKKFEILGKHFKKKIKCLLVKNNGPIGNGIGPALEMIDVIKVLRREDKCHKLEEESLVLSAELLELTGKAKKGKGLELAKTILDSGKAFDKFKEIIKAQKGKIKTLKTAKFQKSLSFPRSGKIIDIDNKKINHLARTLGCPKDKFAGIYLNYHEGQKVKKGQKIMTLYSETKSRLNKAVKFYKSEKIIRIK